MGAANVPNVTCVLMQVQAFSCDEWWRIMREQAPWRVLRLRLDGPQSSCLDECAVGRVEGEWDFVEPSTGLCALSWRGEVRCSYFGMKVMECDTE